jgi:ADP-heptose:LPS heptosyltransferase
MLANEISHAVYLKCPHVGRFYVDRWARGSRWRMRPLLGLLGAIRRERYDIVVADVTQRSLRYGLVALFSGARHRIGFDVADRGFLFSTRVPLEWDASVVDANLSLARALGATVRSSALDAYFDADDEAYAASLLPETTGDGPLVSIHPASNWQAKMWVPERWAALADALVDRFHATVVFVGSSGERAYVDEVRQHMRQPATSLAGRTTLSQVGALLARCDLVIGTDSGPRHLAAGSNRPQVTLMSAHEYVQRWHFDREQEIVLRTAVPCSPCFQSHCWHQSCMRAISVEAVLAASGELLSRSTVQPVAVPA